MIFTNRDAVRIILSPGSLLIVLLLLICNQLAQLTWRIWLPAETYHYSVSAIAEKENNAGEHGALSSLLTLFGTAADTPPSAASSAAEQLHDAPVSLLNFHVTGIVASPVAALSIAIVAQGNRQYSLGVGDTLPGHNASISAIFADRVVISYQGKYETLPLFSDRVKTAPVAAPRGADKPSAQSDPEQPLARLKEDLLKQVKKQPQTILGYLNIAPVMEEDRLVGYRLNPGKQGALFQRAGLRPNDLAVSFNGLDLRDGQQAQRALKQLPELDAVNLTVEREGQLHDIYFSLGDD
ncbi:type II secretion system protein GspC [Zobellella sp. DQSA1]|uniref:type II secretion system protein GspC n=1 Tax=Zobellella sp. DQSA1 TaxID=3342386 RepID=UPI0035C11C61